MRMDALCRGCRGMFAASKAATTQMDKVAFGPSIPGFVAGPKGAPGVIIIQEWWGVTEEVRLHAARIASNGFRVIIPDLYRGKTSVNAEEASHLMGSLEFPAAVAEVGLAAKFLKAEGSRKVGVVGFCMGGVLSLGAAATSDDIACACTFYGVNFELFEAAQLKAKPVCGHFGELDTMAGFSDPETARKLEAMLRAAGNERASVTIHAGVGHAMMNASPAPFASFEERSLKLGFPPYNEPTAEAAWTDTLSFLTRHLVIG